MSDHTLSGAYALDAVDDVDRARFERELADSPDLQAEVASLQEAAALLGAATAEAPPPRLRASVLAAIDTTRQLPPVVDGVTATTPQRHESRPVTREWVTRLSYGAAAVFAVIAIGLGVAVVQLDGRLDDLETANSRIATVVAAADAQRVAVSLPDGGRVSAVISVDQGAAIVVGDQLADPGEDHQYALWSIVDGTPFPVGEMIDGHALAVDAAGLEALGVTIEPRGPLTQPTSDPIGVLSV